jgi:hypothetical protein
LSVLVLLAGCQKLRTAEQPAKPVERKAPSPAEKVADIIVDNSDAGFRTEGDWQAAETGSDFKGGVVWAVGGSVANAKATWTPDIKVAGTYELYEWHGADPNDDHATNAPFAINYDGGSKTVFVNLRQNIAKWNLLGTFKFAPGASGNVILTNAANGNVVADAIKLVYK